MKLTINWGDVRALVSYGDKEHKKDDDPLGVTLIDDNLNSKLQFTFDDEEQRACCISMSCRSLKRPVRLTKSMDLITRLGGDNE